MSTDEAVTHSSREKGCLLLYGLHSDCFLSLYYGLRVTLSDVDAL